MDEDVDGKCWDCERDECELGDKCESLEVCAKREDEDYPASSTGPGLLSISPCKEHKQLWLKCEGKCVNTTLSCDASVNQKRLAAPPARNDVVSQLETFQRGSRGRYRRGKKFQKI